MAGEAAEHGDLAGVGEGVGDGSLEEAVDGFFAQLGGGEGGVKDFEGAEEPGDFLWPGERRGVVPFLIVVNEGEGPVHEVAHVGEDLDGGFGVGSDDEAGEMVRGVFDGAQGAVGERGEGVAERECGAGFWHDAAIFAQRCGRRVLR